MSSLKLHLDWDLSKSRHEETDELPLMATPGPVLIILAVYLLFVLKVGPALMTKREPFKLTGVLLLYNTIQVVLSMYMVQLYFNDFMEKGILPKKCYMNDNHHRKEILTGIWIYFMAKVSELLDTVFFVLRKKYNQITFLHLYHHSCMMIGTWALIKYWPTHTVFFIGLLNSLVHVFMYAYYGLAALGPKVTKYIFWKKYITRFQMIQFVSVILHYIAAVRSSDCPPTRNIIIFIICNTAFFLLLFYNFYRHSYKKVDKTQTNGIHKNLETKEISEEYKTK
ncbi:elongation of very long chain fatty acids protein-like isoform X2 [Aricia agestis]|uniref:elongation of very long chain fatty acids protein-like isoform X2 n=1 Tax=Aricia agestis TaxID=91739 RepID=UPI001C20AB57|nr:elongation of very long chain fatty acids protein-like isoform X2 [Aricia agestis]